jgi:hypothetical protein
MTAVEEIRRAIAEAVAAQPPIVLVASEMEPHLLRIRDLVRAAETDARPELAKIFSAVIRGELDAPDWLVSFCMMDLRWAEVLEAARAERTSGRPRNLSLASEVIDVYEGRWGGYGLFATYPEPSEP